MSKKKKVGPTRAEIQAVVRVMNDAFDAGARTGILYFPNGFRGQLLASGQLEVDWQSDIGGTYKGVYGAPINYSYTMKFAPRQEMYPEVASGDRSN